MERASPKFLPSIAIRPQIVVLYAFCGIKNTQKIDFGGPDPPLGKLKSHC